MAEGLELADEVAGFAGGVEVTAVPVGTELLVGGVRVVDQVPGDDEYRAGDGDQSFGVAAASDDAPVAGAEEGVGAGGGVGGLTESALEPGVSLPGRARVFFTPHWIVRGHNLAQDPRCSGVGKRLMSAPNSARMICALVGPMPETASGFRPESVHSVSSTAEEKRRHLEAGEQRVNPDFLPAIGRSLRDIVEFSTRTEINDTTLAEPAAELEQTAYPERPPGAERRPLR